jgi:hypothetical protein
MATLWEWLLDGCLEVGVMGWFIGYGLSGLSSAFCSSLEYVSLETQAIDS